MDLRGYIKRALDRYDDPNEPHNKKGGWPRGELAWAMAKDLREGLEKNPPNKANLPAAPYNCTGCLQPSMFGNFTQHGKFVIVPTISLLMKLAILPNANANNPGKVMISASFRNFILYFLQKRYVTAAIPNIPPCSDKPPFHIAKISNGFAR